MRCFLLIVFLSPALTGCSQCTKITDYKEKKRDNYLNKIIGTIVEDPNWHERDLKHEVYIVGLEAATLLQHLSLRELKFIHTYMNKGLAKMLSVHLELVSEGREDRDIDSMRYSTVNFYASLRDLCLIHSVVEKYEFCRRYQPPRYQPYLKL